MVRDPGFLSALAQAGFASLGAARSRVDELRAIGIDVVPWLTDFRAAADPDQSLVAMAALAERARDVTLEVISDDVWRQNFIRVAGVSAGLAEFFHRHPHEIDSIRLRPSRLPERASFEATLDAAVRSAPSGASHDEIASALRVSYRRLLSMIALYDIDAADSSAEFATIVRALSDLADAAITTATTSARHLVETECADQFSSAEFAAMQFSVIGMGKLGAQELNYVSDVDVIFVGDTADPALLPTDRALDVATRTAKTLMRLLSDTNVEPPLWEVDANLRPEGKQGALVRTLSSHLAYYGRWAKNWEFQALLKARFVTGDPDIGSAYVDGVAPFIWRSSSAANFVEQAQRMRERVTELIPRDDVHYDIKLGPGGLRDIEFTVQLLQLVHGRVDASLRLRGTIPTLSALASGGYIARDDASDLAAYYRMLRLIEHRLQLQLLRRTHLMPRDDEELRVLARSTGLAPTGSALVSRWESTKHQVRQLHLQLFYRPLLAAVASLGDDDVRLTSPQASDRLAAIGFNDPDGALNHIRALTRGVSRRAAIQRSLLPVLLRWLGEGANPDYGLLAFRRLSDKLGGTHWYLRMLRDSTGAAKRLTHALSTSRFIGELLDFVPESAAWLENDAQLAVRPATALRAEAEAVAFRHSSLQDAANAVQRLRRREVLRMALGSVSSVLTLAELSRGLSEVTEIALATLLERVRAEYGATSDRLEFAIIGMGRLGGREVGFGSDADVLYVYRAVNDDDNVADLARRVATELQAAAADQRVPFDLDAGLRPEGKNGPLVRTLAGYETYYRRWSLTWEAQALLRARGIAGDQDLITDFERLADSVRYRDDLSDMDTREIRRIKARIENERLPHGEDPSRQLKLGRGSLSDVEWYVQLIQLQHAHAIDGLRTTSTLEALSAATREQLIDPDDAQILRDAWILASRLRSANTLWLNRPRDVLPSDRVALDGIARILEYPPHSANELEETYLSTTRRSRAVFERAFYDLSDASSPQSESSGRAHESDV